MMLQNRFNAGDRRDVTVEKVQREGVAYLRVVPAETAKPPGSRRPWPTAGPGRSLQVGPLLLWFVEFSAFMAFPVILILMAWHPQFFCLTGCIANGSPAP